MSTFKVISTSSLTVSILTLIFAALVLSAHSRMLSYGAQSIPYNVAQDSKAYIKIASGHLADVESPFSKRILYPYVVGKIAGLLRIDLATAFMGANFLCLGIFAYCVSSCLEVTVGKPFFALIPLLCAFSYESLAMAYLPDLFHAAFTALFFLLLLKEQRGWALFILFFLCLARDNTFFLCAVTCVVAYRWKDQVLFKGSALVFILGVAVSSILARQGKPNIHHLWEPLYLALKVPYNFFANVFGLFIWTNVRSDVGQPLFIWRVPSFLQSLGKDHEIGLVIVGRQPMNTLTVLLSIFGSGPLFLSYFYSKWKRIEMPFVIHLALVYGVLSYFLGIALGNWVFRLVGYGWPAFFIALPYLLTRIGYRPQGWAAGGLLACFWAISWLPSIMQQDPNRWAVIFPLLALFYGVTILIMAKTDGFRITPT